MCDACGHVDQTTCYATAAWFFLSLFQMNIMIIVPDACSVYYSLQVMVIIRVRFWLAYIVSSA